MEEKKGAKFGDMGFGRPNKKICLCAKCVYRKPNSVIKTSPKETVVIEQWDNSECEKYYDKPNNIIWSGAECEYFKADGGVRQ